MSILKGKLENGTTKGKSKIVYVSSDNKMIARRVKFDRFGVKQGEIDQRTLYIEGILGDVSANQLIEYIEKEFHISPIHTRVLKEGCNNKWIRKKHFD